MVTWMENLMILAFCASIAVLSLRFLKHDCSAPLIERLYVITMGIGFVIGLIVAIMRGMTWQVMLYGAGICCPMAQWSCPFRRERRNAQ